MHPLEGTRALPCTPREPLPRPTWTPALPRPRRAVRCAGGPGWVTGGCVCAPSSEAGPDFELKVELYSAALAGGPAQGSAPRKLATRLSTSLGRSSGRRVRAAMDGAPGSPPGNGGTAPLLLPAPSVP